MPGAAGRLDHILALDRRSIALFRMALGGALLVDLLTRLPDVRAFYTDDGVLPRDAWLDISEPWWWSLHLATGSLLGQLLLLALAAVPATGLLVGVRPRLCAAASYFFLLSLYFRNPLAADFGDWTLQAVLLWTIFLPPSAPRWPWERFEGPARVRSVATAALLAQLLLLYATSAAHKVKLASAWVDGTVLMTVLELKATATPPGLWLAGHPGLCAALSYATLGLELLGPVLLFLPWRNGTARLVAAVAFIGFHLFIRLFLRLGFFTLDSVVPWLVVLPEGFWSRVLKREASPPGTEEAPLPRWAKALAIALLSVVALWSVVSASPAAKQLDRFERFTGPVGLAHVWSMFAGSQFKNGWFRAPATLKSGARVDLLTGQPPLDGPPPDPAVPYGSRRSTNYQSKLFRDVGKDLWVAWASWLCTRDRHAADPPVEVQLERVVERPGGGHDTEVLVTGKCLGAP